MSIYAALANLSCGSLCLLMALMFRKNKKAANYIAGYNTMSEEEKARYNEKELCRFLSRLLLFCSALMIVTGIIIVFNIYIWAMLICSWSVFVIVFIFSIINLTHNARFKAEPKGR